MKKECDIVQDLLFGYIDGTLKDGSKELVENHLNNCKECENILNSLKGDEEKNSDIEKINGLKKVNRKMRNKKILLFITTFLLSFVVIFNIIIYVNYIYNAGKIKIYIENETNEELNKKINLIVKDIDDDGMISYVSKAQALQEFKDSFKRNFERRR